MPINVREVNGYFEDTHSDNSDNSLISNPDNKCQFWIKPQYDLSHKKHHLEIFSSEDVKINSEKNIYIQTQKSNASINAPQIDLDASQLVNLTTPKSIISSMVVENDIDKSILSVSSEKALSINVPNSTIDINSSAGVKINSAASTYIDSEKITLTNTVATGAQNKSSPNIYLNGSSSTSEIDLSADKIFIDSSSINIKDTDYLKFGNDSLETLLSGINTNILSLETDLENGAITVGNATHATKDSDGNVIKDIYAKIESLTNGDIKVQKSTWSDDAGAVNSLNIYRDANGVLRIGDIIIPQKRLLWRSTKSDGATHGNAETIVLNEQLKSGDIVEVDYQYRNHRYLIKCRVGRSIRIQGVYFWGSTSEIYDIYLDVGTSETTVPKEWVYELGAAAANKNGVQSHFYAIYKIIE